MFSSCIQPDGGLSGYCKPIRLANIGRCFTTTACIAEVPIGGVCAPGLLQECTTGSVCVSGACTADAAVLAAVPLGGGGGDSAATCVAERACRGGSTRRQRVAPIGVAFRVRTRTVAAGKL